MLFNSVEYWLFLPLVWLLYFGLPFKIRWIWLLVCSYFFYGFWKAEFAALMAFTSLIDWWCARQTEKQEKPGLRKFWLWFSILSNVAMLFMFKYFDFALGGSELANKLYHNPYTAWLIELGKYTIPAGISFYTFQSISYVVDVYRKKEKAEKNLFRFMLYVSFFPQLVAGPIERFGKLHTQLFQKYMPVWEDIRAGGRLLLYGLFLKVCVADNLAGVVDTWYHSPEQYTLFSAWMAVFCFAFQVYADFFGYSLLAQGSALLFGVHLMDNFTKPYIAKSVPEFWHRWHISLSTWFRDYIFIPVGGNKQGVIVLSFSVLLVFFTSGLWHGANTTMIVFGLSQGILYLFDRFAFSRIPFNGRIWDVFRQVKTFAFFMLTLVWFRSPDLPMSSRVFSLLQGKNTGTMQLELQWTVLGMLALFIVLDLFLVPGRIDVWFQRFPLPVRWAMYAILAVCIAWLGGAADHPFVYFQF
ncbi:MAG: MBOAT family protein [Bacteroidetes bacterium]|nr:MBOAT family protein [Bacteroidota bacterium]